MSQKTDNILLDIRNDDSQVNVRKIRDHLVENAYVGASLRARLNNDTGATVPWELTGGHSDNFGSLPLYLQGNLLVTLGYIPESLAYQDFWVEYRLKDSESTGTIGRIEDEFDRYKTKFTINYNYDDNGTITPGAVEFKAPNSVTKYLMGWNPEDPINYQLYTQLDPITTQQAFVDFFANMQDIVNLSDNEMKLSRIVNRNTPYPLNSPDNPFYDTLALLDGISQDDVLVQDDLYPTLVTLEMTNYADASQPVFSPAMADMTIPAELGVHPNKNVYYRHTYDVTMQNTSYPLYVYFRGQSENLLPEAEITQVSPGQYKVHVNLRSGPAVTQENLQVLFSAVPLADGEIPPDTGIDEAIINIDSDPNNLTVKQLLDHRVNTDYVGAALDIDLNSIGGTGSDYELVGNSSNFDGLNLFLGGDRITTYFTPIPESLAYQDFWIDYILKDSDNAGTVRRIEDEFDRYMTKFTIDYMFDDNGTMTPGFVEFKAPNSVTKYLMGWNPEDPINYQQYTTLDPISSQQAFVDFFANMQDIVNLPDNEMKLSRIVNRNTPYPLNSPDNPFYDKLALLDGISQDDVLVQDDLYPIGVTLEMTNYGT